jgi:hypothetical protein
MPYKAFYKKMVVYMVSPYKRLRMAPNADTAYSSGRSAEHITASLPPINILTDFEGRYIKIRLEKD